MKIKPIILSGGSGRRLWPLSREKLPKQFFDFFNENTNLFEKTVARVNNLDFEAPVIISNKSQRYNLLSSLKNKKLKYDKIILEESSKNTAPAFAVATYFCKNDQVLCFLPSDHYIKNNLKLVKALKKASKIAINDKLIILGLKSKNANENYGYIQCKTKKIFKDCFEVDSFIEKPNKKKAEKLFKNKCLWNSGIVIVKNSYLKTLFTKYAKILYENVKYSCDKSFKNMEFINLGSEDWNKINSISFDYAILEKKFAKIVMPIDITWSDLGSYDSICNISDTIGNVEKINTRNCFTFSNDKLLVTNDVQNLNIINTKDITLVTKKGKSQEVRNILDKLKKKRKEEFSKELDSNRPWGNFSTLGEGKGYKVKKLKIFPGQKISLQKHYKRSEHWVVIEGNAVITKGKRQFKLKPNQSTFIKKGELHRIENKSTKTLIMIEVQTGEYLEENDIKRFKDIYNR